MATSSLLNYVVVKIMNNTLRFNCYHCIHCCFFVSIEETPIVLEDEIEVLRHEARRIGKELEFTKIGNGLFRWILKGFCPFYSIKDRRCSIHQIKPLSCKMYPLLLNIKTWDIHISTACDWVLEHINELLYNDDLNLSEVFKNEVSAIRALLKAYLLKSQA